MSWSDKVKKLLAKYLGNQAGTKYITTESGLRLQISDFSPTEATKSTGNWSDKTKSS